MEKFDCPSKFITIVRQFHDGMSMVFSAMLTDAFRDYQDGIHVRYRTDSRLFNLRCQQVVNKVKVTVSRDFLFADDCALNSGTKQKMQHEMDCFSRACDIFGLIISTKKIEVMKHIMEKGQELQAVDSFTYLGSTLSRAVNIDAEVINRIAKASSAFGRLRENVWERRGLSLTTKLKVYRAVVLTTLLYACETWAVYSRHAKQLNRFHLSCLRRLLRIKWQDKISDTEVLELASIPSIHTLLQKAQVRWAGHVVRMVDSRLPEQLLYGELCEGKRSVGGQKKRGHEHQRQHLGAACYQSLNLAKQSLHRCLCSREATYDGSAEETCSAQSSSCLHFQRSTHPHLSRVWASPRARIGLINHLGTHSN
ncbi:uncharacterized protein LOC125047580 [Penaeus chinensis]|uniref:uncharacterized protein LOC125047580 n=1 Tax=Penaeus chinensis TaxID=139456 RepID=UPI001FB7CC25|nr:uncharacterized protein LOC125047580 [Penaeus chinensis]